MKNLHLVLVLFSIASMFTSFGVYDVDATKDDNNGSNGCDNSKGKGNDKAQACERNPNANSNGDCLDPEAGTPDDCDGDGLSNDQEIDWAATNPAKYDCLDPENPDSDGDEIPDGDDAFPCTGV